MPPWTSAGKVSLTVLKDVGRSQQRALGHGGSMLPETHPALSEPPRPPAVCGEGERSVNGYCRGGSGSDCRVTGAKPQRGPSERADTLLQDTSRHDGEKWLALAPSVQGEGGTGSRAQRYACAQHRRCRYSACYFICAFYSIIYKTHDQKHEQMNTVISKGEM